MVVGDEVGVENVADAHLGSVVGAAEIGADAGDQTLKTSWLPRRRHFADPITTITTPRAN